MAEAEPVAALPDKSVVVNEGLQEFWKNLWHVDVKKDHKGDYDGSIVEELIPGKGGSDANGKEGLFHDLIRRPLNNDPINANYKESYNIFQNAKGLQADGKLPGINTIKVNWAGYEYDYKYFDRPRNPEEYTRVADEINAFLQVEKLFRYTDTSRGGSEFLCAYPTAADGSPKLLHANTREVESDPASKISGERLRTVCDPDKANQVFYYEPDENKYNIVFPAWDTAVTNNTALAAFYCSKTLVMKLLKVKDSGKLDVQLTFFIADDRPVEITEKMNIASSFKKLVSNIKEFLNIKTPADLKQAIFISKHHGDIGQVLSPFYPRKLRNLVSGYTIFSNKYPSAFESYDVNPVLKAFSVGEDIIWFHTSPTDPVNQKIIIFKRTDIGDPNAYLTYLRAQLIAEQGKATTYLEGYSAAVIVIKTAIDKFQVSLNAHFAAYPEANNLTLATVNAAIRGRLGDATVDALLLIANTWRNSVRGTANINTRYGMILQKASEFAVLSKSLAKGIEDYDQEDLATINSYTPEIIAAATKDQAQAALNTITEIMQKYKFPKEQLDSSQKVFKVDNTLAATTIQKDIAVISDAAYKGFTKKTMANMWSFINVKGGRSRVVSFEPKRITAFGLKAIHLITKSLDEFEEGMTYSGAFITMLRRSAAADTAGSSADISLDINTTIDLLLPGGAAARAFVGGRRKTRKQRGGQQQLQLLMKRDRQLEIMMELLKDCKIYFTFVLDNMANPSRTLSQMDTFLQDMHGIKLDFSETEEFNLRGGGEEEIIDKFGTSPDLLAELDETFFEGANEADEYSYGMITPSYTHFQTLFKEMCKAFSQPNRRSELLAKRDALYELMYVMQQFGMIMNLTAAQLDTEEFEEYKNFEEEIGEIKKELATTNYFADCDIFKEVFQEAIGFPVPAAGAEADAGERAIQRGKIFRGINKEVLEDIAGRLVLKLKEGAAELGVGPRGREVPLPAARQLFEAEANYGKAMSNLEKLKANMATATAKGAAGADEVAALGDQIQAAEAEVVRRKAAGNAVVKMPAEEYGLPWSVLKGKLYQNAVEKLAWKIIEGGEIYPAKRSARLLRNITLVNRDNPVLTYNDIKTYLQKGARHTPGNIGINEEWFAKGAPEVVPANPFTVEGGARKTQRRRKNENKKRRKTKSKSKHGRRV